MMTAIRAAVAILGLAAFTGAGGAFEISSPSLASGKWDQKYLATDCGGQNVSPALEWKDAPEGTKSFVLTLFDKDALDGFGWWHWQVLRLPAPMTGLPEGAGSNGSKAMPKGVVQGKADLGRAGYLGPCLKAGTGPHQFVFTLYAMKGAAEIEGGASPGMILADVMRETIGKATAVYPYGE
jgi:Raf kinase inhibitor-like YbhB/YbcL family protein